MSAFWLRIGGVPATEIAAHTPVEYETWADGGSGVASWAMSLSVRSQHQALRRGSLVEVMCGPMRVWTGTLTEPDRTTWECHAVGLSGGLRNYFALDGAGNATRGLSISVATAVGLGWRGYNPGITGGVAGDDARPISVGALWDQFAEQTGQRWGTTGTGRLYMRPDPVEPSWLAAPDAAAFGVTDEDQVTRLAGRFFDGSSYVTAFAGTPGRDGDVGDLLLDRGTLGLLEAQAILGGMLVRDRGTRWTNGAVLHREQLTTIGGTPAFLASVVAGQKMRSLGIGYGIAEGALRLDAVIGKTRYVTGEETIYVEPVNAAPRTFVDVQAAA